VKFVELLEKLTYIQFFVQTDSNTELEHGTDRGCQGPARYKTGPIRGQLGSIDPVTKNDAVEQLSDHGYF
jgi:hypothetical protein